MKVIVIDDDRFMRSIVSELIERAGGETVEFEDGVGLEAYIDRHKPDLLIIDYHIAGENGLEVALKVRSNNIPLIKKPFTFDEFMIKLKSVLANG